MSLAHTLLPTLLAILAIAPLASAQSLAELTERARSYDAVWQARQAETAAAYSRSEQARAGLLPTVGLQAGASRARPAPGGLSRVDPGGSIDRMRGAQPQPATVPR